MSILPKKFPTPVAKPMGPFFAAGLVILYGINSFGNLLMSTEEYKNDPRNPNLKNKH
ncbi:ATPase, F0 complex, subunit J [Aspergillus ambiguus]|uniref:F1F0 ATP synthase subunit i n=1 Tax=Aspergillus ambiguus TaxID=176160 RepID=UPI003CCDFC35